MGDRLTASGPMIPAEWVDCAAGEAARAEAAGKGGIVLIRLRGAYVIPLARDARKAADAGVPASFLLTQFAFYIERLSRALVRVAVIDAP
jgi:hypothetical protein